MSLMFCKDRRSINAGLASDLNECLSDKNLHRKSRGGTPAIASSAPVSVELNNPKQVRSAPLDALKSDPMK